MSKRYRGFYVKYPLLLSHFRETNYPNRFLKIIGKPNFMTICLLRAEMVNADGSGNSHDEADSRFP